MIQVYVGDRSDVLQMPERELRAFSKVHLASGGSERIELPIARSRPPATSIPKPAGCSPADRWRCRSGRHPETFGCTPSLDVPGHPVEIPLTIWSQLGDWMTIPVAGPALRKLIEERGGIKGRVARSA